jgi:hypothetical protein
LKDLRTPTFALLLCYISQIEGEIVYFIFIVFHINIDNFMIYVRMSFFTMLVAFALVVFPTFATNSSSQSDNSISNSSQVNNSIANVTASDESDDETPAFENETSFASLSRSLAETNQTEEPVPPPPPSESTSNDESDDEGASD